MQKFENIINKLYNKSLKIFKIRSMKNRIFK